MNLINAKRNETYLITEVNSSDQDIVSRFYKLGFTPGQQLKLKRKAPIFGDPLLIEVGESQIALTKSEANCISIKPIEA